MKEVAEKKPWLTAEVVNPAEPFEFVTAAGVTLSGSVTLPLRPARQAAAARGALPGLPRVA